MVEDKEDKALWHKVTKTVKAYRKDRHVHHERPKTTIKEKAVKVEKADLALPPIKKTIALQPPQMDRSTKKKLTKGELRPEDRIDLHGMTQAAAHAALTRFIVRSVKSGLRTLLVITGKGKNMDGVLRKSLPLWLDDEKLKPHIISIVAAASKDGGAGAFYIRLRNANKIKKD